MDLYEYFYKGLIDEFWEDIRNHKIYFKRNNLNAYFYDNYFLKDLDIDDNLKYRVIESVVNNSILNWKIPEMPTELIETEMKDRYLYDNYTYDTRVENYLSITIFYFEKKYIEKYNSGKYLICHECGKLFLKNRLGRPWWYCDKCKKIAIKNKHKKYNSKRK